MNYFFSSFKKNAVASAILSLLAGSTSSSSYANQEAVREYHIEVVVFERTRAAYRAPEYWPNDIALSYPLNYRVIQAPVIDTEVSEANTSTPADHLAAPSLHAERRVMERAASQYLLTEQARAIDQKNDFRVLFHKAWQQPLITTEWAPAIIITGGDEFDHRTELGGSIRISVNKFIHVDTQLWLARFTPNLGQESLWPMPPIAPTNQTANTHNSTNTTLDLNANNLEYGITAPILSAPSQSLLNSQSVLASENNTFSGSTLGGSTQLQAKSTTRYLTDEVIVLAQSRRMRSQELHYIDHPRLGLLIKAVPLSFEESQAQ